MNWKACATRWACSLLLITGALCAISCGSTKAPGGNNNGTLCPNGSADLTPWFGLWLTTDSTFDCNGTLQNVSTDSLVLCFRSSPTNIGSSALGDSSLICTATNCSATSVTASCTGQATVGACVAHYSISYTAIRTGENVHANVTLNNTYTGDCGGRPALCQKIGSQWHRATTDTSLFGRLGGGGIGTTSGTLSMKVNGTPWSATQVSAIITGVAPPALYISVGNSLLPATSLDIYATNTAGIVPGSYSPTNSSLNGQMAYNAGAATYVAGAAADNLTLATVNGSTHRITGSFHFTGVVYPPGANASITEGTFDMTYEQAGLSPWSHRLWKAIYRPRG